MATQPGVANPPKKLCSPLPKFDPITIPLPFGGVLTSITDPSKGPPTDCTLVHSLMLQIMPMLAGLTCLLRVLNVISAIEKSTKATPPIVGGVPDILDAIAKMKSCFGFFDPTNILAMIKAILRMILGYLGCLINAFESIRNFKVGIDLNAEGGTPVLINTLDCANNNADTSLASMLAALGAIQPLMDLLDMIGGIVGQDLGLPKLSAFQGGDDPLQPLIDFRDTLQEITDKIPG